MRKMFLRLGTLSICLGLMIAFGASTAFAGTTPAITNIAHKNAVNRVLVEFNAPVWGDTAFTTALAAADFQLGGTCGATSISSVTHAAGDDWAVLVVAGTIAADESACTIAAKANSIFTVGGAFSEKTLAWDATADATAPIINVGGAEALNGQAELMITFSEHVYGEADGTAALVNADFAYDDVAGGTDADACTGTAAGTTLHVAGNDWAVWTCSVALTTAADIDDNEEMDLAGATNVYDLFGNAAIAAQNVNITADAGAPAFATHFVATKGEATVGGTKILVKFSEPVFDAATPVLTDLVNADFAYTDTTATTRVLSGTAQQTLDQQYVVLTVDSAFAAADLTVATADTIDEALNAIYDAFGNAKNEAAIGLQDNTDPVILSLAYQVNAGGQNQFILTYSEKVTITGLTTGGATMAADTATVGDYSVLGALQGFGAFATVGTITVPATKNTLAIDSAQTVITVTMAGASGGYIATSTTTITVPSGVFTPEITGAGIQDLRPAADTANDIEITSTQSTLTTTTAWDTTRPTISSGVLSDTFSNDAAFVAGGTFNTGTDGRADQIIFTASEALRGSTLTPDAAGTRNDWAITAAAGEFGNSLVVIKAAPVTAGDTGTTYTINFSGAQSYYADPSTFNVVNTQDTAPSLTDRAGNPVASGKTSETYRVCFTGLTCSGSSIGNVAVITNGITQPAGGGGDTTGPAAPTGFAITLDGNLKPVLAWTDPTASDFNTIQILKSKGEGVTPTTVLDTVAKGVKTYTDTSAVLGEVLNYILKPFDLSGNAGTATDAVSITVEEGAEGEEVADDEAAADEAADDEATDDETTDDEAIDDEAADDTAADDEAADDDMAEEDEEEEMEVGADLAGHWSEPEVTPLIEYGIVKGDAATGNVRPDDNLNRGEAGALLYRVLGLDEPSEPEEKPFSDVDTDDWFAGYIAHLKLLELVTGNPDGTYRPANDINRAEFLTLAMRVYYYISDDDAQEEIDDLRAGSKTDAYVDLRDGWYTANVTAATELGFVSGKTCTGGKCFDASASITRAEAAAILYRMFNDYLSG